MKQYRNCRHSWLQSMQQKVNCHLFGPLRDELHFASNYHFFGLTRNDRMHWRMSWGLLKSGVKAMISIKALNNIPFNNTLQSFSFFHIFISLYYSFSYSFFQSSMVFLTLYHSFSLFTSLFLTVFFRLKCLFYVGEGCRIQGSISIKTDSKVVINNRIF